MPTYLNLASRANSWFCLLWRSLYVVALLLGLPNALQARSAAEDTIVVNAKRPEFYLEDNYYSVLEDPTGRLKISDIQSPEWAQRFRVLHGTGQPGNPASIQHLLATHYRTASACRSSGLVPGAL
jgi:hypothetical protein